MHLFLNILAFASIGLFVNGEEWCAKAASVTECMNRCLNNPICLASEFLYNNGDCFSYNTNYHKTHYIVGNWYYSKPMEKIFNPVKSDVALKAPKKNGVCPPDQVKNGDTVPLPNGHKYSFRLQEDSKFEIKEV